MAIVRPTPKATNTGGTNKFAGICEVGIVNFTDKSGDYDWADVYIEIEFALKDSKYTRNMQLTGSLDKDANGMVEGGYVLDRLYRIFDAIDCKAGINTKGEWEDEDGKAITDIAAYLNTNHCSNFMPGTDPVLDYVAYIYKTANKKTGALFNAMLPKLYPNGANGKKEMASYVKWMKANNHLKEVNEGPTSEKPVVSAEAL
tara:strand:- start:665 stop:1267 length:603 start_codon:yes stop_codon:yes gene_type:complete